MKVKTESGFLGFLYRFFIEQDVEDDTFDLSDPTAKVLAEQAKNIDKKYEEYFSSTSGKSKKQFKVDENELNKEKNSSFMGSKVSSKDKEENIR